MTYFTNEDPVHANLTLPDYVREIVATKEFQRLHKLKQLGVSHFVFEKAIHTRAEHCIGTAYLSYRLVNHLEQDSGKKIKPLYKKCVILAALLHDIGHGPYSHLWEGVVHQGAHKDWTHEDQSKKIVEHIFSKIRLHESNEQHDVALKLLTSFITCEVNVWDEVLTPEEMFLTEIVSNKFCKIDVDKCDYLSRDLHYLNGLVTVKPFIDFLSRARILYDNDGTSHIGYHQDDFDLIENMFYNRAYYHMNIYQQHQVAAAEKMVKEICVKSSAGGVTVSGLELTEVQNDVEAFTQLDDTVLDLIAESEVKNDLIQEAQKILADLKEGRRYNLIWETCENDGEKILEELVSKFGKIFCVVGKFIPAAEVPTNIPLYNDYLDRVEMTSSLKLSYKSEMIYCTSPDSTIVNNVKNFFNSCSTIINNNNV